ncbi:MAG TPA: condensation domain-containing protein, partial [Thermoanaerobaculia bacterium]|nr:condensation domain-containing protein [Thermoanaerobaculia bacterium]
MTVPEKKVAPAVDAAGGTESAREAEILEGFRLSPQQRRAWQVQKEIVGRPLVCQAVVRLDGELRRDLLIRSLEDLVARHDVLRTVFPRPAGVTVPVQSIRDRWSPAPEVVDLRNLGPVEGRGRMADLFSEHRRAPLDLGTTPGLRVALARLADDRHGLLVTVPALCADVRTLRNLVEQVASIYDRRVRGVVETADAEVVQYLQVSEWQLQLLEEGQAKASDLPPEAGEASGRLPFERDGGAHDPEPAACPIVLPPEAEAAVRRKVLPTGAPDPTVLLCAWHVFLALLAGSPGSTIAVPFDGRKYSDLHDSFGRFERWLPVTVELAPDLPFEDAVGRTRSAVEEVASCQEYFAAPEGEVARAGVRWTAWPARVEGGGVTFRLDDLRVEDEPVRLTLAARWRDGHLELSLLHHPRFL